MLPVAAIPAALKIAGAVKDFFSGLGNLFGGKLVYGVKKESFPQRWTSWKIFASQFTAGADSGGKGTWWWDPAEQGGAGVKERLANTVDVGMTMGDWYVYLLAKESNLDNALDTLHKWFYMDTLSNKPKGYATRGEFASKERDGQLNQYRQAYYEKFGAAASPLAGPKPAAAGGSSVAPGLAAMTSGGMPVLLGLVALAAFVLVRK